MSDRNKIRTLMALVILLAAALSIAAYKFIVVGNTLKSQDGRTAILLTAAERDLVLAEMRGFVEAVRDITGALAKDDFVAAAAAAKRVGMANANEVPPALIGKLPLEFKQLGFSVHTDFDQMALDAKNLGMTKFSLEQLSATLAKCAGCHAAYQLKAIAP